MPDYISWYVVELRQQLAGHGFSLDRIDEISRESESHLRETAAELRVTMNMTEEESQKSAIGAYGPPDRIASGHYSGCDIRVFGLHPLWPTLAGATLAIASWDFEWTTLNGYWDIYGDSWMNAVAGLIGCCGLAIFCFGCARMRRSARLPILGLTAGIVAFLPFLLSFWIVGSTWDQQGISRFHLARDEAHITRNLKNLEPFEGYFRTGISIFEKANHPSDVPADFRNYPAAAAKWGFEDATLAAYGRFGNPLLDGDHPIGLTLGEVYPKSKPSERFLAPRESGVFAFVDGRVYAADEAPNLEIAKRQWAKYGSTTLEGVIRSETDMQSLLASVGEARRGRIFFFDSNKYSNAIAWTITFLPVLLLIDGGIVGLSRRRFVRRKAVLV